MYREPAEPPSPPLTLRPEPFEVGPWHVEPLALRLSRGDGTEARLEPRVMALLVQLAAADGQPVTHEALVASVWQGAFISSDAVHGAISKLRRALETDLPTGSAIESLPRVGYRLRLPVQRAVPTSLTRSAAAEAAGIGRALEGPGTVRLVRTHAWARRLAWGLAIVAAAVGLISFVTTRSHWRASMSPTTAPVARPLTSFPGLEIEPAFAPNGTGDRVAFSWKGPSQEHWDVYVTVVGGGPPLRLTQDPGADRHPTWAPDATRIAFVRRSESECGLWTVAALGRDERRLASCRDPADLAYAPDGRTLYFSDRAVPDAPYRLYALDLASGEARPLVDPPARGMGDHAVVPAPSGGGVAFLRSPVLGVEDVWLLEAAGKPRRLTFYDLKIHGFDWLPDGRSLIASSNRGGLFSLWRLPVNGGQPAWLGLSGGDLDAPTVSGDGRRVAFEQWQEDTNLYRLDLSDPVRPHPLLGSTRWDFQPALSPEGERLAFVSDRTGSSELWTAAADGGSPSQRTQFGGPYLTAPQWSPDGRRIVFDLRAAGNGDLWVLDSDGAAPRQLTDTPATDLAPTWSRDGRSVLFASDRTGTWELWRLDLESRKAGPVTQGGGYRGIETQNGALVFCRADRAGLWMMSQGDATPRLLVDDLAPVDRANWAIAADVLVYVVRPTPDRPALVKLELRSGRRTIVGPLRDFPFTSGLALSPDAGFVLLSRVDRSESDLLWMELPEGRD